MIFGKCIVCKSQVDGEEAEIMCNICDMRASSLYEECWGERYKITKICTNCDIEALEFHCNLNHRSVDVV